MSLQRELFRKEWGKEASSLPHQAELELAKDIALKLASEKGEVTIDDVRSALPRMEFGNWAGSIFKGAGWICVGFTQATHKNSHARIVRRWKFR